MIWVLRRAGIVVLICQCGIHLTLIRSSLPGSLDDWWGRNTEYWQALYFFEECVGQKPQIDQQGQQL